MNKTSRIKRVVAIHDISCMGRCSLTVALPILSTLGIETIILPTSILSTHTSGFVGFTNLDLADETKKIIDHWQNYPRKINAIYSGFLGSIKQIEITKEYINRMKKDSIILIDPAMADNGKVYPIFNQEYVDKMIDLCKDANIVVPNITEACIMTNTNYLGNIQTKEQIEELLNKIIDLGIEKVVLTSVSFNENEIGVATKEKGKETIYTMNQTISGYYHGTGDVYASALLGAYLNDNSLSDSAKIAADFIVNAINETTDKEDFDPKYGVNFELVLGDLINKVKEK